MLTKQIRASITNFSTLPPSTTISPTSSIHWQTLSPTIFKQKIRERRKQSLITHNRCHHDCSKRHDYSQHGQVSHNSINWIIYNILVGIYKNWLRLAPFIIHLLDATKRHKIQDVERLIQNVKRDKERIQNLIIKQRTFRMQKAKYIRYTQFIDNNIEEIDDKLLQELEKICGQIKYSTQLLNGHILINSRVIKTEKENLLTNNLLSKLKKNYKFGPKNKIKNIIVDDHVEKVAQTIVERIGVFKYLRKNKMKVDQRLLSPLKKIFKNSKDIEKFEKQIVITANEVIEKIKLNLYNENEAIRHYNRLKSKKYTHKEVDSQDNDEMLNEQLCGTGIFGVPNEFTSISRKMIDGKMFKSKKKVVFPDEEQNEDELINKSLKDIKNNRMLSKNTYQIYNQRKFIWDKEGHRQTNKGQNKDKSPKSINKLLFDPGRNQQNNHRQKRLASLKSKNKIQVNESSQTKIDKQKQAASEFNDKTKITSAAHIISARIRSRKMIEEKENDSGSDNNSIDERIMNKNKGKKVIKSGKLMRKIGKKKTTVKLNQNFPHQIENQSHESENILLKQYKPNPSPQAEQEKLKQSNKMVSYSGSAEDQLSKVAKFRRIQKERRTGRHYLSLDSQALSYHTSHKPQNEQKDNNNYQFIRKQKPFEFLTQLNKQAMQNWRDTNYKKKSSDLYLFQIGKYEGMDCDLDIPIIQKDDRKRHRKHYIRQANALDLGLSLLRSFNNNVVKQKAINIQKQILV